MTTVEKTIQSLSNYAESIRNTDAHDLSGMEIGDEWRQGDVSIKRRADDFIKSNAGSLISTPTRLQLAPGETQGSRHCLDSLAGVEAFVLADATPLDGPILRFGEPRSILHPEHGDLMNLPPGVYGVTYQRARSEELARVAD